MDADGRRATSPARLRPWPSSFAQGGIPRPLRPRSSQLLAWSFTSQDLRSPAPFAGAREAVGVFLLSDPTRVNEMCCREWSHVANRQARIVLLDIHYRLVEFADFVHPHEKRPTKYRILCGLDHGARRVPDRQRNQSLEYRLGQTLPMCNHQRRYL